LWSVWILLLIHCQFLHIFAHLAAFENGEAPALISLRQDLESLHKEEMDELRSEYDTAIASLTERHQKEVAKFQVDIEAQSNE